MMHQFSSVCHWTKDQDTWKFHSTTFTKFMNYECINKVLHSNKSRINAFSQYSFVFQLCLISSLHLLTLTMTVNCQYQLRDRPHQVPPHLKLPLKNQRNQRKKGEKHSRTLLHFNAPVYMYTCSHIMHHPSSLIVHYKLKYLWTDSTYFSKKKTEEDKENEGEDSDDSSQINVSIFYKMPKRSRTSCVSHIVQSFCP